MVDFEVHQILVYRCLRCLLMIVLLRQVAETFGTVLEAMFTRVTLRIRLVPQSLGRLVRWELH